MAHQPFELRGKHRWVADRLLGEGSFASVWHAYRSDRPGVEAAIKLFHMKANEDTMLGRRARYEVEVLQSLAAVSGGQERLQLLDQGKTKDGRGWYAMTFISGSTLAEHLADHGDTPQSGQAPDVWAAAVGAQLARVLQALHQQGYVHRDIKPENVIMSAPDAPVLIDFGAMYDARQADRTTVAVDIYSVPYRAPDAKETQPVPRTDVYALGVMLVEMAVGRRVSGPSMVHAQLAQIHNSALRGLIQRMTASTADHRPDMVEVARTLESLAQGTRHTQIDPHRPLRHAPPPPASATPGHRTPYAAAFGDDDPAAGPTPRPTPGHPPASYAGAAAPAASRAAASASDTSGPSPQGQSATKPTSRRGCTRLLLALAALVLLLLCAGVYLASTNTQGTGAMLTQAVQQVSPTCGDGVVQTWEECDDGNKVDGDGCSATCTWETVAAFPTAPTGAAGSAPAAGSANAAAPGQTPPPGPAPGTQPAGAAGNTTTAAAATAATTPAAQGANTPSTRPTAPPKPTAPGTTSAPPPSLQLPADPSGSVATANTAKPAPSPTPTPPQPPPGSASAAPPPASAPPPGLPADDAALRQRIAALETADDRGGFGALLRDLGNTPGHLKNYSGAALIDLVRVSTRAFDRAVVPGPDLVQAIAQRAPSAAVSCEEGHLWLAWARPGMQGVDGTSIGPLWRDLCQRCTQQHPEREDAASPSACRRVPDYTFVNGRCVHRHNQLYASGCGG